MTQDEASHRQISAADPDRSTWLSANAGSGKTKVLTDRVTRLLLEGTDPQNILCLTFTKAAAAEMQNRLFKQLGSWAMLPDQQLDDALRTLGVDPDMGKARRVQARRLFARSIETPGGIKIQTIHSFCSALLRRFPLEAGIPPQFSELDDRSAALLRDEVFENLAADEPDLVYGLAQTYTGDSLDELIAEIIRARDSFPADVSERKLSQVLGLSPDQSRQELFDEVLLGDENEMLTRLQQLTAGGGPKDAGLSAALSALLPVTEQDLPALEDIFLTKSGAKEPFSAKTDSVPTKSIRLAHPELTDRLNAFMSRLEQARPTRLALDMRDQATALHRFARVFLMAYAEAKLDRGFLDFDDLIQRSHALLTSRQAAEWVLYKLDGGIDHILVDEAQDTSPMQWKLIERLAEEFTSGQGARAGRARTVFVVGDKKQSIYSFQGADPNAFDRMKGQFRDRLSATETPLQDLEMEYSFRSSSVILSAVDAVFADRASSGFSQKEPHKAFWTELPGRVDVWPPVEHQVSDGKVDWTLPQVMLQPDDPPSILARRIAAEIKTMIGTTFRDRDGKVRVITEGDFLILVRKRSGIFPEMIRACKEAGLNIAGADRLRVGAELAVRDIRALLSFLATPEDDLALATALRSPLFGWSEQELFSLAHARGERYLWAALRQNADLHPFTKQVLDDLRSAADYLRPYDVIERVLTRHDGRTRLLSRLGPEAEDGIDALLAQAMTYEQSAVDSLTGFLVWMERDDLEIKRQLDDGGDRIRVMTVHGAKGLQAPIVILPDCAAVTSPRMSKLLIDDGIAVLRPRKDAAPTRISDIEEMERLANAAERDRLLYVAMTRAENWLIVAAAGKLDKASDDWHSRVRLGLEVRGATGLETPVGQGLRLEQGPWNLAPPGHAARALQQPAMSDHFLRVAPQPKQSAATIAPSDLPGAKALPGEDGLDEDAAKRRGRQIHRLLEVLPDIPAGLWAETAKDLLSRGKDAAGGSELEFLYAEAEKVLTKPGLQHLFHPDALAEVSITANVEPLGGARIHGTIDRLIVDADSILAVDFKTNAIVPDSPEDCPDALVRQMGAYAHALAEIYPEHTIETALLWTRTATLMPLPQALVTRTLNTRPVS
ncbi:MAG: double-strand break repair helicase AddA [Pseudomonadota bacterium]